MPEPKFILVPLGSAGDINPLIWLGQILRDRGHQVLRVMQSAMVDYGRRAGLNVTPIGSDAQQESVLRNPDIWHPRKAFGLLAQHLPGWARETIPVLDREIVSRRTVLIGAGIAFGARIIAEARQVPLVTTQLQPAIFMSPHDSPVLVRGMERLKRRPLWLRKCLFRLGAFETDRLLKRSINRLRGEFGLDRPVSQILSRWALSSDLVLALFPEWFGPRQPDWPTCTVHTRFPLYDQASERPASREVEDFLSEGPPPVLLTPGSANMHARRFFEAGLAACLQLGLRVIVVTPFKDHLPLRLPAQAAHFDFLPFSSVFPRCRAVIHHGGVGTCAQGMAAGVPQLIMAMAHDQPDNGWRLRQLGIGDYLYPSEFKPSAVAQRLSALLEPSTGSFCETVRQLMGHQMAPPRVAELLENFAATRLASS